MISDEAKTENNTEGGETMFVPGTGSPRSILTPRPSSTPYSET